MKLLRISFLLLLVLLSFNVASAEQSQQKEQVEYSFITLKEYLNAPDAVQVIDVRSEQSRQRR